MELEEWRIKRNKRIRSLYRSNTSIKEISDGLAIDEKLIRDICKGIKNRNVETMETKEI